MNKCIILLGHVYRQRPLTDWTKDNNDDKFFDWMDKDKQSYCRKSPRRLKKQGKSKKIIVSGLVGIAVIILVLSIVSGNNEFSSENYFYIPDYRLNKSPVFCAQEFSDSAFPDANKTLMTKTICPASQMNGHKI